MSAGAFSGRSAAVLAGLVSLSVAACLLLWVFGPELSEPASFRADAFSRSALGHHAFLEVVRRGGRTVILSRNRTAEKAREGATTALLEPDVGEPEEDPRSSARVRDVAAGARRLLVVLPKREGPPDGDRPRWVKSVQYRPPEAAQRVLDALEVEGTVIRPAVSVGAWTGPLPAPALDDPQLVRSDALTPLLATPEGVLVGEAELPEGTLLLVADPDLLETHGLGRGRNAELALALLDRLGGPPALIVDETLHGHDIEPSLLRELLRFPLVLATLQAVVALGLLGWAAAVRFGRPLRTPPPLRAGKEFLVDNVAELLRAGGHAGEAARAYLRAAREEVLARLPPPGASEPAGAWLSRLEATRGLGGTLRSLERQVAGIGDGKRGSEAEALRAARRIQRWREELTHGAAGDPRPGRGPQG